MTQIKQWLLLEPLDTLFCKGSEPMIAGESHEVRSVFPPMPSTILGALITAILYQRQIRPQDFTRDSGPSPEIVENYRLLGSPGQPEFEVAGPIFRITNMDGEQDWFLPVPAHWFGPVPATSLEGYGKPVEQMKVTTGDILPDNLKAMGLLGSVSNPVWVLDPSEPDLRSLSGCWANAAAFDATAHGAGEVGFHASVKTVNPRQPAMIGPRQLFGNELRVGIALKANTRRVLPGHLYSAVQVRLCDGAAMAVGLSETLTPSHLDAEGILRLGGEQRVVRYHTLDQEPDYRPGKGPWVMALSPLPYNDLERHGWTDAARASAGLIRMGGWDMKKGFHKPMCAYVPAGTVIRHVAEADIPFGFIRVN
ncbi:MAG: type III-B CRISPR module-associated Cmr3 family protein [Pseudomonadota bacterium]